MMSQRIGPLPKPEGTSGSQESLEGHLGGPWLSSGSTWLCALGPVTEERAGSLLAPGVDAENVQTMCIGQILPPLPA